MVFNVFICVVKYVYFKVKIDYLVEFGFEKFYWSKEYNLLNLIFKIFEENEKLFYLDFRDFMELNLFWFIFC